MAAPLWKFAGHTIDFRLGAVARSQGGEHACAVLNVSDFERVLERGYRWLRLALYELREAGTETGEHQRVLSIEMLVMCRGTKRGGSHLGQ